MAFFIAIFIYIALLFIVFLYFIKQKNEFIKYSNTKESFLNISIVSSSDIQKEKAPPKKDEIIK